VRLLCSVLIVAVLPAMAGAQRTAHWRASIAMSAPGRVLDAGPGTIGFGLGGALEAAWVQRLANGADVAYLVRAASAAVKGEQAGSEWEPGRATMLDAAIRIERVWQRGIGLFAGPGISHWRGPDDTVPFAGIGGVLLGAEAGALWRPTARDWQLTLTSRMTRIGPDDERAVSSGFVFRWLVGVQRAF
jgi:hypothetical protein